MSKRFARDESGFQLIELMVVVTLTIVVMSAVLLLLENFQTTTRANELQNDSQEQARRTLGLMARELRNLASPTNELPEAVERNGPQDLIFLSAAKTKPNLSLNVRNTHRVRYCVGSGRLYRQEHNWTTATASLPAANTCPATATTNGWTTGRVVAQDLSNGTRAVFSYDSTTLTRITEITPRLHIDTTPGASPAETTIETGMYLRNQNRVPTAAFSATASGIEIVLDGSDSSDPEGQVLTYEWLCTSASTPGSGCPKTIGTGPVYHWRPGAGTYGVRLKVTDPAGLTQTSATKSVCLAGIVVSC
ncbi:MAG: hypothetical protein H0V29_00030 [Thermoleophilaceae bacterium]|nr:hypothetical protein [Thermoleophilaceae bacterium]